VTPPAEHPYDEAIEQDMDAAIREISAIDDPRMVEMAVAEFNKRFGAYLIARLNDEVNP
jgi:hypothetical protein